MGSGSGLYIKEAITEDDDLGQICNVQISASRMKRQKKENTWTFF